MGVDVRVMVPRVRRALEGTGAPVLTDDAIKDIIADSLSAIVLYTGSLFGGTLDVTATDSVTGAPTEYATSDPLTLAQGTVVAAQAALDFFFFEFAGMKMSESISDEASTWEYSLSPNLLRDQLKFLQAARDKALEGAAAGDTGLYDGYVSFLAARDVYTSRLVEPWVYGVSDGPYGIASGSGQFDPRFDP